MRLQSLVLGLAGVVAATVALSAGQAAADKLAKLGNPSGLTERAPATYKANFDTSKGLFVIEVHRDWSPQGAKRIHELVKAGFYDDCRFFRVIRKTKPTEKDFVVIVDDRIDQAAHRVAQGVNLLCRESELH